MVITTTPIELTPQQRLAISRKAIVRHMQRHDRDERDDQHALDNNSKSGNANFANELDDDNHGHWALIKRALKSWWHHHPASIAMDVAKPLIGRYAQEHPVQLIGIAAGVGAAAVVFKPWRLVSVGGIVLAALKSSDLTGIVLSMLTPSNQSSQPSQSNS